MRDQVADRKQALHAAESGKGALGRDAFSMLVAANESENEKLKLSDQELIGNVFVMLFAGHGVHESIYFTLLVLMLISVHRNDGAHSCSDSGIHGLV